MFRLSSVKLSLHLSEALLSVLTWFVRTAAMCRSHLDTPLKRNLQFHLCVESNSGVNPLQC